MDHESWVSFRPQKLCLKHGITVDQVDICMQQDCLMTTVTESQNQPKYYCVHNKLVSMILVLLKQHDGWTGFLYNKHDNVSFWWPLSGWTGFSHCDTDPLPSHDLRQDLRGLMQDFYRPHVLPVSYQPTASEHLQWPHWPQSGKITSSWWHPSWFTNRLLNLEMFHSQTMLDTTTTITTSSYSMAVFPDESGSASSFPVKSFSSIWSKSKPPD